MISPLPAAATQNTESTLHSVLSPYDYFMLEQGAELNHTLQNFEKNKLIFSNGEVENVIVPMEKMVAVPITEFSLEFNDNNGNKIYKRGAKFYYCYCDKFISFDDIIRLYNESTGYGDFMNQFNDQHLDRIGDLYQIKEKIISAYMDLKKDLTDSFDLSDELGAIQSALRDSNSVQKAVIEKKVNMLQRIINENNTKVSKWSSTTERVDTLKDLFKTIEDKGHCKDEEDTYVLENWLFNEFADLHLSSVSAVFVEQYGDILLYIKGLEQNLIETTDGMRYKKKSVSAVQNYAETISEAVTDYNTIILENIIGTNNDEDEYHYNDWVQRFKRVIQSLPHLVSKPKSLDRRIFKCEYLEEGTAGNAKEPRNGNCQVCLDSDVMCYYVGDCGKCPTIDNGQYGEHKYFCGDCVENVTKCPICKTHIIKANKDVPDSDSEEEDDEVVVDDNEEEDEVNDAALNAFLVQDNINDHLIDDDSDDTTDDDSEDEEEEEE